MTLIETVDENPFITLKVHDFDEMKWYEGKFFNSKWWALNRSDYRSKTKIAPESNWTKRKMSANSFQKAGEWTSWYTSMRVPSITRCSLEAERRATELYRRETQKMKISILSCNSLEGWDLVRSIRTRTEHSLTNWKKNWIQPINYVWYPIISTGNWNY